jgi:hypothetical protein
LFDVNAPPSMFSAGFFVRRESVVTTKFHLFQFFYPFQ